MENGSYFSDGTRPSEETLSHFYGGVRAYSPDSPVCKRWLGWSVEHQQFPCLLDVRQLPETDWTEYRFDAGLYIVWRPNERDAVIVGS